MIPTVEVVLLVLLLGFIIGALMSRK